MTFSLSFEFFPPKTPQGDKKFLASARKLAAFSPEFFSVTFGAGGSTREGTIQAIKVLKQETLIPATPHISCIGATRAEILSLITEYKALGVKRLVALRGDLPSGMGHVGELRYASDLVELIRKETQDYFHIDVAAYPEVHPQAKNVWEDISNLKRKVDAGANSVITQYFYNPDAYFYFLDQCAKQDIYVPIVPGIMPITQFSNLVRFSDVCGAEIPRWMRKRLESYGDDIASIKAFGLEVVYDLCQRLLHGGAPGLHFYTLNQSEASENLIKMLNLQVKIKEQQRLK